MKLSSRKELLKEAEEELKNIREAGANPLDKLDPRIAKGVAFAAGEIMKIGDEVKKMQNTMTQFAQKTNRLLTKISQDLTKALKGKKYYATGNLGNTPDEIDYVRAEVGFVKGKVYIEVNFQGGWAPKFELDEFFKEVLPKIR